jgi:hypothetical protein
MSLCCPPSVLFRLYYSRVQLLTGFWNGFEVDLQSYPANSLI